MELLQGSSYRKEPVHRSRQQSAGTWPPGHVPLRWPQITCKPFSCPMHKSGVMSTLSFCSPRLKRRLQQHRILANTPCSPQHHEPRPAPSDACSQPCGPEPACSSSEAHEPLDLPSKAAAWLPCLQPQHADHGGLGAAACLPLRRALHALLKASASPGPALPVPAHQLQQQCAQLADLLAAAEAAAAGALGELGLQATTNQAGSRRAGRRYARRKERRRLKQAGAGLAAADVLGQSLPAGGSSQGGPPSSWPGEGGALAGVADWALLLGRLQAWGMPVGPGERPSLHERMTHALMHAHVCMRTYLPAHTYPPTHTQPHPLPHPLASQPSTHPLGNALTLTQHSHPHPHPYPPHIHSHLKPPSPLPLHMHLHTCTLTHTHTYTQPYTRMHTHHPSHTYTTIPLPCSLATGAVPGRAAVAGGLASGRRHAATTNPSHQRKQTRVQQWRWPRRWRRRAGAFGVLRVRAAAAHTSAQPCRHA